MKGQGYLVVHRGVVTELDNAKLPCFTYSLKMVEKNQM
jgi:hypothetical protein